MWELIDSFPRQIAFPDRRIAHNREEFLQIFNRYNGYKKKMYYSVYGCNAKGQFFDRDNNVKPNINVIGFDLDSENKIECIKSLHEYGKLHNYRHLMIFSTNGFWIYFKTRNGDNLAFPKDALLNAHIHIINENGLSAYERNEHGDIDPHINDVDFHILGDIARITRLPLSYDTSRKRYCIPITEEDLNKGFAHIVEKSKRPVYDFVWYGEDTIDMKEFDFRKEQDAFATVIPDGNYDYDSMYEGLFNGVFPCVHGWITKQYRATWKARYYAAIWLRDAGYPKSFTYELLKKYYSQYPRTDGYRHNWEHMERVRVLDYVYDINKDSFFPRCETLYQEGLCPGKCKYINTMYKWEDK